MFPATKAPWSDMVDTELVSAAAVLTGIFIPLKNTLIPAGFHGLLLDGLPCPQEFSRDHTERLNVISYIQADLLGAVDGILNQVIILPRHEQFEGRPLALVLL